MSKIRCSLCGGLLVDNKCTFCGLDNSIYHRERQLERSFSSQDQERLNSYARRTKTTENTYSGQAQTQQDPYSSHTRRASPPGKATRPEGRSSSRAAYERQKNAGNKRRRLIFILTIVILISALPGLFRIGRSWLDTLRSMSDVLEWSDDDPNSNSGYDDSSDTYEYDPYEYVTEEIPETGSTFETVLGNGNYMVGVHIPEGVYTAELVAGNGTLSADHEDYSIYEYVYFGSDPEYDEVTVKEDLRLYNGELVQIDSNLIVHLTTSNAQPLEQEPAANPLSEPVFLDEGTYIAGDGEIPEGLFDISYDTASGEDYGYASISLTYPGGLREYCWVNSPEATVISDEYTDVSARNIVFSEGTVVTVEYGGIILEPSEGYYDIDYSQYE